VLCSPSFPKRPLVCLSFSQRAFSRTRDPQWASGSHKNNILAAPMVGLIAKMHVLPPPELTSCVCTSGAQVLVCGMRGLAAEVCKNIVLAGGFFPPTKLHPPQPALIDGRSCCETPSCLFFRRRYVSCNAISHSHVRRRGQRSPHGQRTCDRGRSWRAVFPGRRGRGQALSCRSKPGRIAGYQAVPIFWNLSRRDARARLSLAIYRSRSFIHS